MKTHIKQLGLILIALFIFSACNNVGKNKDVTKIGVIIPLTGQYSDYGIQMKRGIDLWVKENPKSNIEIIYEDGKATPKESVSAFNLLLNKNVSAVITGFSGVVLALAPIAEDNKIPLINGGATNPNIKNTGAYIFNVIPDAEVEAQFIAKYLIDSLKIYECSIYWQNNDAGKGMYEYFSTNFIKLGGKIIDCLPHNIDQQDYKNDLMKIKNSNAKTVFIPTYSKDLGLIIKQASDIGLNDILWVGYAATETNDVISTAGTRLDGNLIYSYYEYDTKSGSANTKTENFNMAFKESYKAEPGLYSATFYDAISIIADAVAQKKQIKDFIYAIDDFQGVLGTLKFNHKNYISSGMKMKMVSEQKFVDFQKSKLNFKHIR
jgi:branched-chain amino acid transport system substrate-binding protein